MRLKEVRLENNLLQKDISKMIDVKRSTYSMWELEQDTIPLKKLILLAEFYHLSIDYLLGLSNEKKIINKKFNYNLYLERLKIIRKEDKITQAKLAQKLNTANSVISRYENGKTFILTSFLIQYALYFNISCDYILGYTNEKEKIKNTHKN